jgi:hypothetical protein|tara:strand:+ start:376 stop:582 length:207 start_codon:yes stop_codon:yes gene_type:complete
MKHSMFYSKTPDIKQGEGSINKTIHKHLVKSFPEGKASLSQIKEALPLNIFKQFLEQTNTIYVGVNDK